MNYDAQDLFEYAMENGVVLDVSEIIEVMSMEFTDIMDAFDYAVGVPLEVLLDE